MAATGHIGKWMVTRCSIFSSTMQVLPYADTESPCKFQAQFSNLVMLAASTSCMHSV